MARSACSMLLALACVLCPLAAIATPPAIFAAASLQPALDELAREGALGKPAPQLVYAASSSLARQIEDGAPAAVFISADARWMDDAARHGAIVAATRRDLLGNALVLVAPADSPAPAGLPGGAQRVLAALGAHGRLAVALVDSVPAGIYARQSLLHLGLWDALAPRLAMARDVRAALNLVVLGQCPLGIVYRSDAVSEPRVRIIATFPADSHEAIVYQAAIATGHDEAAARALLDALQGDRARAIFRRWGFSVLPRSHP